MRPRRYPTAFSGSSHLCAIAVMAALCAQTINPGYRRTIEGSAWADSATSTAGSSTSGKPTVTIAYPVRNSEVSGTKCAVVITYVAGRARVCRLELLIDNLVRYTESIDPPESVNTKTYQFDTTQFSDAPHQIATRVYDTAGNSAQASIDVYVSNTTTDTTPPVVGITNPKPNQTVSGKTSVDILARDNVAVKFVILFVDNTLKLMTNHPPYNWVWDTLATEKKKDGTIGPLYPNGPHQLMAEATDPSGNKGQSPIVPVMVYNPENDSSVNKTPMAPAFSKQSSPFAPLGETPPKSPSDQNPTPRVPNENDNPSTTVTTGVLPSTGIGPSGQAAPSANRKTELLSPTGTIPTKASPPTAVQAPEKKTPTAAAPQTANKFAKMSGERQITKAAPQLSDIMAAEAPFSWTTRRDGVSLPQPTVVAPGLRPWSRRPTSIPTTMQSAGNPGIQQVTVTASPLIARLEVSFARPLMSVPEAMSRAGKSIAEPVVLTARAPSRRADVARTSSEPASSPPSHTQRKMDIRMSQPAETPKLKTTTSVASTGSGKAGPLLSKVLQQSEVTMETPAFNLEAASSAGTAQVTTPDSAPRRVGRTTHQPLLTMAAHGALETIYLMQAASAGQAEHGLSAQSSLLLSEPSDNLKTTSRPRTATAATSPVLSTAARWASTTVDGIFPSAMTGAKEQRHAGLGQPMSTKPDDELKSVAAALRANGERRLTDRQRSITNVPERTTVRQGAANRRIVTSPSATPRTSRVHHPAVNLLAEAVQETPSSRNPLPLYRNLSPRISEPERGPRKQEAPFEKFTRLPQSTREPSGRTHTTINRLRKADVTRTVEGVRNARIAINPPKEIRITQPETRVLLNPTKARRAEILLAKTATGTRGVKVPQTSPPITSAPDKFVTIEMRDNIGNVGSPVRAAVRHRYLVRKGDTLGSIGKEYGVTTKALMDANGLKDPRRIQTGRQLIIPPGPIIVYFDAQPMRFTPQPSIFSGIALAPFRPIFEHAGGGVVWIPKGKQVVAQSDSQKIKLQIGSDIALVNESEVKLDIAAFLRAGRTIVPLKFFRVALGAEVNWDPETGNIEIRTK